MGEVRSWQYCLITIWLLSASFTLMEASYPHPGDSDYLSDYFYDYLDYGSDGDDYDFAVPPIADDFGAEGPSPDDVHNVAEEPSSALPPTHHDEPTGSAMFDVMDYGAVPYRQKDNTKAFGKAWGKACAAGGKSATLLVPNMTFYLGPVKFEGPCNNSPTVVIKGTLVAPSSLSAFPKKYWILISDLNGITITGGDLAFGTLDGNGHEAWKKRKHLKLTQYRILKFVNVMNAYVSRITLLNSKGYHMSFTDSKNILVQDINITAPWDSPNTDGIHTASTDNINITDSVIGVGDDCVSIGPGSTNVNVYKVKCGPGHGISIGSLGKYKGEGDVGEVHVRNCNITNTTNGVRIKTWPESDPSKAYNISFLNIAVLNVTNPIIIDQEYCPTDGCKYSKPSKVQISNVTFTNITGTTSLKDEPAVSIICSAAAPCQNVKLVQVNVTQVEFDSEHKRLKKEPGTVESNHHVKGFKVINSTLRPATIPQKSL